MKSPSRLCTFRVWRGFGCGDIPSYDDLEESILISEGYSLVLRIKANLANLVEDRAIRMTLYAEGSSTTIKLAEGIRSLPGVRRKLAERDRELTKMTQGSSPEEDRETRWKIIGGSRKVFWELGRS
ncbi:hypothetical protein BHE74_00024491 [Ensete ventricosum]|nr:hypothetical protein BHE74_00024491 [Ensete ventricosum]